MEQPKRPVAMIGILVALLAVTACDLNQPNDPNDPNPTSSENLAKGCTVTASSVQSGNLESYLVDGDPVTQWSADADGNAWFTVDLGGVKRVSMIKLRPSYVNNGIISYTLERSDDGSSWTKVMDSPGYSVTTPATDCAPLILDGFSVSCRYLRVTTTSWCSPSWVAAFEFEVYN